MAPGSEVEIKLKAWKGIDAEIQQLFSQKQQALSQFNENTLVKGELDLISKEDDTSSTVFKLIGPILVTVDLEGAKENVAKAGAKVKAKAAYFSRRAKSYALRAT